MIDTQPFIDAITANPGDDTPRLVFADWLEDRGECARAEFIRVGCELAKMPDPTVCTKCGNKLVRQPMTSYPDMTRCSTCSFTHGPFWGVTQANIQVYSDLQKREQALWLEGRAYWSPQSPSILGDTVNDLSMWSRGFVSHIRCTLADWCGGPCERCDGSGEAIGSDRPGQWSPDPNYMTCPECLGAKTTPGHAGEICLRHPIESVTLTDRQPERVKREPEEVNGWMWFVSEIDLSSHHVPNAIWHHMKRTWHPTEADALTALDRAAVKLGRERAEALRRVRR